MKKITNIIIDHVVGIVAAILYYAIFSICLTVITIPKLFERKKKVKPPDKKMYFNDPFEFAHFQKKKKHFLW